MYDLQRRLDIKIVFRSILGEARKRFKTYVNLLSTIKNENHEKYLILRKRYYSECPVGESDELDLLCTSDYLQSPGSRSGISEHDLRAISTENDSVRGGASDIKHQQEFRKIFWCFYIMYILSTFG